MPPRGAPHRHREAATTVPGAARDEVCQHPIPQPPASAGLQARGKVLEQALRVKRPKPRFFRSPAAFRQWLGKYHNSESELLVGFYKTNSGKPSISYQDALDEALAIGWIDGVRRGIDAQSY